MPLGTWSSTTHICYFQWSGRKIGTYLPVNGSQPSITNGDDDEPRSATVSPINLRTSGTSLGSARGGFARLADGINMRTLPSFFLVFSISFHSRNHICPIRHPKLSVFSALAHQRTRWRKR